MMRLFFCEIKTRLKLHTSFQPHNQQGITVTYSFIFSQGSPLCPHLWLKLERLDWTGGSTAHKLLYIFEE